MADQRTYTAGRFALDIDGFNVGFLKKFSGLHMTGDVASNDLGPDNFQAKHLTNLKWEPGKATIGIGMGKGMYDWIKAAFDKGYITKNGAFLAGDFNYAVKSRHNFYNALITSVVLPKLDGGSKDPAYFDVSFDPESVRWEAGGKGEDIKATYGTKQKAWLCSNFRVEIGGLPCNRVASVDSMEWKCSVVPDAVGIFREHTKHPAKVTVPDVKLSISMADYDEWAKAAKKWFVDGESLEGNHMQGRIVFLDPNMKDELGEVTLHNLGFSKFAKDDFEANSEKVARFQVTLYCEKMDFKINQYDS